MQVGTEACPYKTHQPPKVPPPGADEGDMSRFTAAVTGPTLADVPDSTVENRRRSPRRPYVIEAWVSSPTAVDESERMEATAVNLSRHGICFDMKQDLPVGCFYTIEVGMGEQRLIAEVRIISCRQVTEKTWTIGAAFC
jgi:hypothetical protein